MAVYSIRDNTWNVLDRGQGPPILFIHGFPLDARMWEEQLSAFSEDYRCIIPDLPGFGDTPLGDETWTLERWADDLRLLVRQLVGEQSYFVCGLSMGGYVAWQLWKRERQKIAGLIQCDTRAMGDTPEIARAREMMAATIDEAGIVTLATDMLGKLTHAESATRSPGWVQTLETVLLSATPAGVATAQRAMAEREDVRDSLSLIDVPALLVCGAHDTISTPDEMRDIAEAMPRATLEIIPDAGHLAPWECPTAVNTVLRAFLQSQLDAGGSKEGSI